MKKIALAQMNSRENWEQNLQLAISWIHEASEQNADMIVFPENFLFLGSIKKMLSFSEKIPGKTTKLFQGLAKEKNISILMGSIPEISTKANKIHNTSVFINSKGEYLGKYQKIHLFDISIKKDFSDQKENVESQISLEESKYTCSGNEVVVLEHNRIKIGLSICYDIRFPNLYQKMTYLGAHILMIPSAFTYTTGKAHWLSLLKARAIENQCFVIAPAQCGKHSNKRVSFGHSAVFDPWGNPVCIANEEPMLMICKIDLKQVEVIQKQMPVQQHKIQGIDI